MAIDIEALKAKLEKMNNRGKGGGSFPSHLWKPDYGEYEVRIIPWPETMDVPERPFLERWFYYDLGKGLVAPPLNQDDPVRELRNSLFEDRTEENLALARKMRPKMRAFVPIIVRNSANETEVKIWSIDQGVYKQLITYIVNAKWGDITDVNQGRDITVTITDSGKKFPDGTIIKDVQATPSPEKTAIFDDKAKCELALNSVPDINEIYAISSYEKLAEALDKFADGGSTGGQTSRGGSQPTQSAAKPAAEGPSTSSLDDEFDKLLNPTG